MPAAGRFDVRSADGTSLAVWADGEGPPLVLVHGALSDHANDEPLVSHLRGGATTFAMDRRGRGASGDGPSYSIRREFEDVAAVVDAVAARAGRRVSVWGHSYGADCAMGAATLTDNIHRLVLYEPGLGLTYPAGSIAAVNDALAAGDNEAAAIALLDGVVELSPDELEYTRSLPTWPARLAVMPTVPRELTAEGGWRYRPGQFDRITAPTLVLAGSLSPAPQAEASRRAAAAISDAKILVLGGHAHIAHRTDPAAVAAIILRFITEE